MSDNLPQGTLIIIIVLYAVPMLLSIPNLIGFVLYHCRKIPAKYHGWQLHLRRGCWIVAGIVSCLLSPLYMYTWCCSLPLIYLLNHLLNKWKKRWKLKRANSKFRSKNKCKQRSGGAEILLPSSIIQDLLLHNQLDHSTFPYISSVSELEDDDGICPLCLRSIHPAKVNRKCNLTEITRDVALDNEPCVTTCNHVMHYKCLREWLKLQLTCPICGSMQLMSQCKVFRCRYAVVKTAVRGDVNTNTINSHNGSTNNGMTLPTISSGVPHMPTVMSGVQGRREATSGECYRQLSVSVDLHDSPVIFVDALIPTYV